MVSAAELRNLAADYAKTEVARPLVHIALLDAADTIELYQEALGNITDCLTEINKSIRKVKEGRTWSVNIAEK